MKKIALVILVGLLLLTPAMALPEDKWVGHHCYIYKTMLEDSFNNGTYYSEIDLDSDGDIDLRDFVMWARHMNMGPKGRNAWCKQVLDGG